MRIPEERAIACYKLTLLSTLGTARHPVAIRGHMSSSSMIRRLFRLEGIQSLRKSHLFHMRSHFSRLPQDSLRHPLLLRVSIAVHKFPGQDNNHRSYSSVPPKRFYNEVLDNMQAMQGKKSSLLQNFVQFDNCFSLFRSLFILKSTHICIMQTCVYLPRITTLR